MFLLMQRLRFLTLATTPVHGKLVVLNCGVIAPGVCLANLIPLAEANGNSYEERMLLYLYFSTTNAPLMKTYTLQLNRQDMKQRST